MTDSPSGKDNAQLPANIQKLFSSIRDEWASTGLKSVSEYQISGKALLSASTPSEIGNAFNDLAVKENNLTNLMGKFLDQIKQGIDTDTADKKIVLENQISLKADQKAELRGKQDKRMNDLLIGYAEMAVGGIIDFMGGFGIGSTTLGADGMRRAGLGVYKSVEHGTSIEGLDADIALLRENIANLKKNEELGAKELRLAEDKFTITPRIYSHMMGHSQKILGALSKYASSHNTTSDAVFEHVRNTEPKVAKALTSLMKANYKVEDIITLASYADTAAISNTPEQRALLQFINHDLVPHMDFLEIWASKCNDIDKLQDELKKYASSFDSEKRPKLEILGEKPISLSGTLQVMPVEADLLPVMSPF